jgi:hypothetical protein
MRVLLFAIAFIVSGRVVGAAPIQFRMTGTIDVQFQVGPLPPGIFQDAPFEAILSYDLSTPDSQAGDPNRGYYSTGGGPDNFVFLRAGVSEIRSIHDLVLWVGNDVDNVQEIFEVPDDTFRMLDSEFTANFEVSRTALMVFQWNDPTRSALSADGLPTSLNPADFVQPFIEVRTFQIDPRVHQFTIHANVDSIEVIPEPIALAYALAALPIFILLTLFVLFHPTGQQLFSVRSSRLFQGGRDEHSERMASVV